MKKIYSFILILIVWTTSNGQESIELSDAVQYTDGIGAIDVYNICTLSPEKIIAAYYKGGSWDGRLKVGTVQNGNTIELGEPFIFTPNDVHTIRLTPLSNNKFFIIYSNNSGFYAMAGKVINGDEILLGNQFTIENTTVHDNSLTTIFGDTAIVAYHDGNQGVSRILETDESLAVSASSNYFFTGTTFHNSASISVERLSNSTFVIAYGDAVGSDGNVRIGTIDQNNDINFGDVSEFSSVQAFTIGVIALQEDKFAIAFKDEYNEFRGALIIGNLDTSNQITYSNKYIFHEDVTIQVSASKLSTNELIIAYTKFVSGPYNYAIRAQINANNVIFSESVLFNENALNGDVTPLTTLIDQKFVVQYVDFDTNYGYLRIGDANQPLSVNSNEDKPIYLIYTDSFNKRLIIETSWSGQVYDVELFDITGRRVHKSNYKNEKFISINLIKFKSGVYIVRLKDGKNTIVKRILVK